MTSKEPLAWNTAGSPTIAPTKSVRTVHLRHPPRRKDMATKAPAAIMVSTKGL